MNVPTKCPICNKKLHLNVKYDSMLFATCYNGKLNTDDFIVHFECAYKEDKIIELYIECGDYYVSICYDMEPSCENFYLYKIKSDTNNSNKDYLEKIMSLSGFFPTIDLTDIDDLRSKIEKWELFL